MSSRLERWLAPRIAARPGDTRREIEDQPTVVHWWRNGVDLGPITVRVVEPRAGQERRGDQSEALVAPLTIVAEMGVPLKARDRLQAENSVVYLITYVAPAQQWRTEAQAEVVSQ